MIRIGTISRTEINGCVRVSANVDINGVERSLWFEVDPAYGQYLCHERSDAFVLAFIQLAFQTGQDICAETPMTDRLYEQLTDQFLPAFNKANNLNLKIHAPIAPEIDHPAGGDRVGTGISCGVDSLHVFAVHKDVQIGCCWSANIQAEVKTDAELAEGIAALQTRGKAFLEASGLQFIAGNTNFDGGCFPGLHWEGMTTYGNLFCVFCLQKLWRKYYIASDCDILNFKFKIDGVFADPARYEYFLFPYLALKHISIHMDGQACTRVEKVRDLVKFPLARRYLNVCWRNHEGHRNGTNDCPKCMRTLLELDAFNSVDDFNEVFDVNYFHTHQHEFLAEYYRGVLQKDNFALELVPYFKDRKFPFIMRIKAIRIVALKAIKKLLRGGRTQLGGFSSRG